MALVLAADDVIVTPLAAADTDRALVHDLVPVLRDQRLHLGDPLETPTTSLVASQQRRKKRSKFDSVNNNSWQTNSLRSRHMKLSYWFNKLRRPACPPWKMLQAWQLGLSRRLPQQPRRSWEQLHKEPLQSWMRQLGSQMEVLMKVSLVQR